MHVQYSVGITTTAAQAKLTHLLTSCEPNSLAITVTVRFILNFKSHITLPNTMHQTEHKKDITVYYNNIILYSNQ